MAPLPLNIVEFAAICEMGFTPKVLGLGSVVVCDKLVHY